MSHEDFDKELNALRENLPTIVEEATGSKSVPQIQYSLEIAKRIVDLSIEGISLHAISQRAEMPAYNTLLKWSKQHSEFSKMLRAVREAKALHFEESAIRIAEECNDKDDVPVARLKVETYWKAAEVNDPATYGKKVTHAGDAQNPVILQVVTGFGAPNEWQTPPKLKADGTIEVPCEVINGRSDSEVSERNADKATGELSGGSALADPPADAPSSDSLRSEHGVETLPVVQRHSPTDGREESASVRSHPVRGDRAQGPTIIGGTG